jgi:hypothetical protein
MKVPLRIIAIDKIKRFVDFAVAGAPTTDGIAPGKGTPRPPAKGHAKGAKKPTPKPAVKTGPQKKRGGSSRRRR